MNSIERGKFEHDPSYDPERLDNGGVEQEQGYEKEVDLRPEFEAFRDNERPQKTESGSDVIDVDGVKIIKLAIPEYRLDSDDNPYRWNIINSQSLAPIARQLDVVIARSFAWSDILVRAVQSASTGMTRGELLTRVRRMGYDQPATDGTYDFYAAAYLPFIKDSTLLATFEAFHRWKPKCEEKPQKLIDLVMVFDATAYGSVEYTHPRHGSLANDRYELKDGAVRSSALLAIILIN